MSRVSKDYNYTGPDSEDIRLEQEAQKAVFNDHMWDKELLKI